MTKNIHWSWSAWNLQVDNNGWSVTAADRETLVAWPLGLPLLPATANGSPALGEVAVREIDAQTVELTTEVCGLPEIAEVRLRLVRKLDHLEMQTSFTAACDG